MWWLWLVAIMTLAFGLITIIIMLIDGHKVIVWRAPISIEDDDQQGIRKPRI